MTGRQAGKSRAGKPRGSPLLPSRTHPRQPGLPPPRTRGGRRVLPPLVPFAAPGHRVAGTAASTTSAPFQLRGKGGLRKTAGMGMGGASTHRLVVDHFISNNRLYLQRWGWECVGVLACVWAGSHQEHPTHPALALPCPAAAAASVPATAAAATAALPQAKVVQTNENGAAHRWSCALNTCASKKMRSKRRLSRSSALVL